MHACIEKPSPITAATQPPKIQREIQTVWVQFLPPKLVFTVSVLIYDIEFLYFLIRVFGNHF